MSMAQPNSRAPEKEYVPKAMRMSNYEQVSSLLVALTILISVACLILFVLWLTTIVRLKPSQVAVEFNDELMGNNNNPEGIAEDFLEPGVEELADVPEPQLADAIEYVTTAVSTQAASLERTEGDAAQQGTGRGLGDNRDPGPGNGGDRVDKPWERWQIRYSTTSPKEYAAQLDFFRIELGAIDRQTPTIIYLSNLSANQPRRRGDTKSLERRIFFNYRDGVLLEWDKDFFRGESIDISDKILVQFYPAAAQQELYRLEREAIGSGRSVADVRRTIFGVRSTGRGYEYFVMNVQYR